MKLEEAKICLSIQVEVKHRLGKDYEAKALQLGLEALIAVERARKGVLIDNVGRLPNETISSS